MKFGASYSVKELSNAEADDLGVMPLKMLREVSSMESRVKVKITHVSSKVSYMGCSSCKKAQYQVSYYELA